MKYIPQLTFLRFLAAFLVVVFHYGKETWPFSSPQISNFVNEGSIAVSFFFFLSGVVLTYNYNHLSDWKNYLKKRFARIFPVYLLGFLLALGLGMLFNNAFPKGNSIILQLFALHTWVPGLCISINFPSWSIGVEVFFYLLFPLLLFLFNRVSNRLFYSVVIGYWALSLVQHFLFGALIYERGNTEIEQFILYFPLWHLNAFVFGLAGARFIKDFQEKDLGKWPTLLWIIGALGVFIALNIHNPIRPYTHNGALSPLFFCIVTGLALDTTKISHWLSAKTLVLLGNSSYAMYLLQFPVYLLFKGAFDLEEDTGNFFWLYSLTLVLVSCFVHIKYENWARKKLLSALS